MKLSIIQIHLLNEECIFKKDNPIFPIQKNAHKIVNSVL